MRATLSFWRCGHARSTSWRGRRCWSTRNCRVRKKSFRSLSSQEITEFELSEKKDDNSDTFTKNENKNVGTYSPVGNKNENKIIDNAVKMDKVGFSGIYPSIKTKSVNVLTIAI